MILRSSEFEDQQEIPQRQGKKIENVSPQLSMGGCAGRDEIVRVSVVDRHPVADSYVHWLVVGLPTSRR
jgi:phosphatidylethanolamine-binding protein (PEBP) family uncharacterized protein